MSKLWTIVLTTIAMLTLQALLFQSWFIRTAVLDLIEPRPDSEQAFVLTNAVELRDHEKRIGELQAGQILYQPCRHDLFLTDPSDPRVLKLYVEFGGSTPWAGYATTLDKLPGRNGTRATLYLESAAKTNQISERLGATNRLPAAAPKRNER